MGKESGKPGKLVRGAKVTAGGITSAPGAYVSYNGIWTNDTLGGAESFDENAEKIAPDFTEIMKNLQVEDPRDKIIKKYNTGVSFAFDSLRSVTGMHANLPTILYKYNADDFKTK